MLPDATGRAFFEPFDVKATNDLFKHAVLILNDPGASEIHGAYVNFEVPSNYVDSAAIVVIYTSTATTGTAALAFDYRSVSGSNIESLDNSSFQETTNGNAVAPGTLNWRRELSIALTDTNIVADDTLEGFLTRDGVIGGPTDDMAAALMVHDLVFEYADA
jgi:hypothetical protein